MLIKCMCSYKPECECGVKKKFDRDGLSYRDIGDKTKRKCKQTRVWFVDVESARDKNVEQLKQAFANACDCCVQHDGKQR